MPKLDVKPWSGKQRTMVLRECKVLWEREKLPCSICHQPIDYGLEYPDGRSCSIEHIKSRSMYPELTWDATNWAPAHLDCNRQNNNQDNLDIGVTSRVW